jgi:large subunit ribosomal protein L16
MKGDAKRGATIAFGSYGLKSLDSHWLTDRQIEAARQALTREMKREGSVWIRVFPDKPITRKPLEVRMGKGKGNLEFWAAVVKPGRILFEVDGVDEKTARASLSLAAGKLPIKTKFVKRRDLETA